jgi:phenylacetate-coenzyme A ligase PaaK-like adenylate-forming protein
MKDLLKKLDRVYQYAVGNEHSDFYRNLYGHDRPKQITTWEDWKRLPLLSKENIAAVPFLKRSFTPYSEIGTVRVTSGTSGGKPLAYPRSVSSAYENHFDDQHPTRCLLNFFAPHHLMQNTCHQAGSGHIVIAGDLNDLSGSLALALRAGLDHIMCTPSTLEALTPLLQEHKACSRIKRIELAGETLTTAGTKRLLATFPNAYLWGDYALTESQGVVGVGPIIPDIGAVYLPTEISHWEIIGDENELVISHTWTVQNHFPLLRYRTGDRVQIVAHDNRDYYRILGRIELDRIKLHGGELRIDIIERAVYGLHPALDGDYELHLARKKVEERTLPEVEIRLTTRGDANAIGGLGDELAPLLAVKIRVAPDYTFADGVRDGHYLPLKCTVVPATFGQSPKTKRFYIDD